MHATIRAIAFCIALGAANAVGAESLSAPAPAGRAWTEIETFRVPGHTRLLPEQLLTDSLGRPLAVASARGGIGSDAFGLRWGGTTWEVRWRLGQGTVYLRPMIGPGRRRGVVWNTPLEFFDPILGGRQWVLAAEDLGDSITVPDTVGHMWSGHYSYGGAVSDRRRWVAFGDRYGMRLLYSDTAAVWREIPVEGTGSAGIGMAMVDDTTALLAWGDEYWPTGIRWGVVSGTRFTEGPRPPNEELNSAVPVWRAHPDGGWWLFWVTKDNHIGVARLQNGVWTEGDSLFADYEPPGRYLTDGRVEVVPDTSAFPALAWDASRGGSYEQVYCVSFPNESGFGRGQQLQTPTDAQPPAFCVDGNGDAWVAWYTFSIQGMYFFHTFVKATASTPSVVGTPAVRALRWTLSEPAPKSWWAVLRAVNEGEFQQLARVQAGDGVVMSYTDSSAPGGSRLRYRIRRESMDTRFEWLSEEGSWVPKKRLLSIRLPGGTVVGNDVEFSLGGAVAGALDVRLYDLQGREVLRGRPGAGGTGEDRVALRFGEARAPIRAGLYFVRVVDAAGGESPAVKVVVVH